MSACSWRRLAIATAVMLKEIALAFWLVAVLFVLVRRGFRAAAVVGWPTPVVFGAWLLYANEIGHAQLMSTIGRWVGSAEGVKIRDPRIHVGIRAWVNLVLEKVIGPVMIFAAGATTALVAIRRGPAPPIVLVPIAYVVVAIAASFVIRLKEPRFVVAIVPMIALSVALLVDWDEVWGAIRGSRPRPGRWARSRCRTDRSGPDSRYTPPSVDDLRRGPERPNSQPAHRRPRDDPKEPSTPWVYPSDASRMPGRASGVRTSPSASRRSRSARTATR